MNPRYEYGHTNKRNSTTPAPEEGKGTYEMALFFIKNKLSVIPLKKGTKEPLIQWKEFQERLPTDEELKKWFLERDADIAVVCGSVSGQLIVIDFDSEESFREWVRNILGKSPTASLLLRSWIVKTGRGYHIYVRINAPRDMFFRTKPKFTEDVDLKGEGGYVVAPPSLHPSGTHYRFVILRPSPGGDDLEPVPIERPTTPIQFLHYDAFMEVLKTLPGFMIEEKPPMTPPQPVPTLRQPEEPRASEEYKRLGIEELNRIVETLKDIYEPGTRQYVALFISGWLAKAKIHPADCAKLLYTLHQGMKDTDPFEQRLSAMLYSYGKAGIDVAPFEEEIRQITGVSIRGVRTEIDESKLKGKSGLQELFEKKLGEMDAINRIKILNDMIGVPSPHYDSIFAPLNFKDGIFAVANLRNPMVVTAEFRNGNVIYRNHVLIGAPGGLKVYESLIGAPRHFEVTWLAKSLKRPLKLGPAELPEILSDLKRNGLVVMPQMAETVLTAIFNKLVESKRAEVIEGVGKPGFYLVDDHRIIGEDIPVILVGGDLKEALRLLDELRKRWYEYAGPRFTTSLKWGIVAPFNYVRKQMGCEYAMPYLNLLGERDTGKTTLGELFTEGIWGFSPGDRSLPAESVSTEARLGEVLASGTFPVVINDAERLFSLPFFANMLKTSQQSLWARGKVKEGKYTKIPALAPLLLTMNPKREFEIEKLDLVPKTLWVYEFTAREVLSDDQKREFNEFIKENWDPLAVIGRETTRIIYEKGKDYLRRGWLDIAEEILAELYKTANLPVPAWIFERLESLSREDILAEKIEDIRSRLVNYIARKYAEARFQTTNLDITEKLEALLLNDMIPFMKLTQNNRVYIFPPILRELDLRVPNLKSLGEMLGWPYGKKSIRFGNRITSASTLSVTLSELKEFLKAEIVEEKHREEVEEVD